MDAELVALLRDWAQHASDAFADRASLARDAREQQAAEVADLAATQLGELAAALTEAMGTRRERLVKAVEDAERIAGAADARFGMWDNAAMRAGSHFLADAAVDHIIVQRDAAEREGDEAHETLRRAREALAAFDQAAGQ